MEEQDQDQRAMRLIQQLGQLAAAIPPATGSDPHPVIAIDGKAMLEHVPIYWLVSRAGTLEDQSLVQRLVVYGDVGAMKGLLEERGVTVATSDVGGIANDRPEVLARAIDQMTPAPTRVIVWGASAMAQGLGPILSRRMTIERLDPEAAGLLDILRALGVPQSALDAVNAAGMEENITLLYQA